MQANPAFVVPARRAIVTIEAHNRLFKGDAIGPATARVLRVLADRIEGMAEAELFGESPIPILDADGNLVGACAVGDVY